MDELQQAVIKGAIDGLKDIGKDFLKSAYAVGKKEFSKQVLNFEVGFKKFLERNYKSISKIKTLANPTTPVSLEATFVSPNLRFDKKVISEKEFLACIHTEKFIVITGIGGSGKSVFLKHLFAKYYTEKMGRIPFFVELRNIQTSSTLLEHMLSQLTALSQVPIDNDVFEYSLKAGKFLFLFDGFDEIETSFADDIAKQILKLSYEFGDNSIILTSRPNGPFDSWNEFHVVGMEPFNKRQVLSLISKMRYDKTAKKQFSELVKKTLYDSHTNYLSNPLLATLMLLTFDQGAEIPSRMHVFFERAFEVLFYKHDATKQTSFRRKFKTSLAPDEFRSIFATFSAFSYLDYGSSFNHSQAIECASNALQYNSSAEKPENFLQDLCSSVSILIREGEFYNYIHRSLQEFFVAQFLAHREIEEWDTLVQRIVVERPNDTVVKQLAEINKDRFEQQFLFPRITALRQDVEAIDVEKNPAQLFHLFYITFSVRDQNVSSWTVGRSDYHPKWHYMPSFIPHSYSKVDDPKQSFNWKAHFACSSIELAPRTIDRGSMEPMEVVDKTLLGTPMVEYLKGLKSQIIAMDKMLSASTERQKKLLSTALIKNKPTNSA